MAHTITTTTTAFASTATAHGVVAVIVVITVIHALLDINKPGAMRFIPEHVRYSFSNHSRLQEREQGTKIIVKKIEH